MFNPSAQSFVPRGYGAPAPTGVNGEVHVNEGCILTAKNNDHVLSSQCMKQSPIIDRFVFTVHQQSAAVGPAAVLPVPARCSGGSARRPGQPRGRRRPRQPGDRLPPSAGRLSPGSGGQPVQPRRRWSVRHAAAEDAAAAAPAASAAAAEQAAADANAAGAASKLTELIGKDGEVTQMSSLFRANRTLPR